MDFFFQRKLQSVVKELREHPDVQDIRDVLDECSRKKRRRSNDADTDNVVSHFSVFVLIVIM